VNNYGDSIDNWMRMGFGRGALELSKLSPGTFLPDVPDIT